MSNILNALQRDLLFDIESHVRSKLNTIVKELKIGEIASLLKMSYSICGDPTSIKVYEIESYLINEELSLINSSQLAMLWLATDDGADYNDTDLNELPYDAYDVFNYVYNNIDLYDSEDYSEEDFLKLLDRQCWLETKIKEYEALYQELESEILDSIEYFDNYNILIPDFVESIDDICFYYVYGEDINTLSYSEYEKYLLYKIEYLIEKEDINKDFFSDMNIFYENFELYVDNPEFYSLLPPIYFAKKIIEAEEFKFSIEPYKDKEINLISMDSSYIMNIMQEHGEDINYSTSIIINTSISEIASFNSDAYKQITYNLSDQRYDHDLSRFLQYTHTLRNSADADTRLRVYNALKKELEDEYNTVRSSIEDFIEKEFPEFGNKKSNINAVKPHIPFTDLASTSTNTKDTLHENNKIEKSKSRTNTKDIFIKIVSIIIILGLIAYAINKNINDRNNEQIRQTKLAEQEQQEKIQHEKRKQDINASVLQKIKFTNAITNWTSLLRKGKPYSIQKIFTSDLEKVLLVNSPILFIGYIDDIKIKNDKEYILTISIDLLNVKGDVLFEDDIQLFLDASRKVIDSFVKDNPGATEGILSNVAVIAKINSVGSTFIVENDEDKLKIKTGYGNMLDIEFMEEYFDMFKN